MTVKHLSHHLSQLKLMENLPAAFKQKLEAVRLDLNSMHLYMKEKINTSFIMSGLEAKTVVKQITFPRQD